VAAAAGGGDVQVAPVLIVLLGSQNPSYQYFVFFYWDQLYAFKRLQYNPAGTWNLVLYFPTLEHLSLSLKSNLALNSLLIGTYFLSI
jgi:hypothetical protein